jgi:ubiquinone/menaquinone biosynthesis C-methylase UbiE
MADQSKSQAERIAREAEIYDGNELQRDKFDAALQYTQLGPARLRRDHLIKSVHTKHVNNKVLEIGSQAWQAHFLKWNLHPTQLTCINISDRELDLGREVATSKNIPVDFRLMDAHELQFDDNTFDMVFGVAILHHLDFEKAVKEIARVTKPGGDILFVEPLLLNPAARLIRALTPKARTPDEMPLARKEIAILDRYFAPKHVYTDLFAFPAAIISQQLKLSPNNWLIRSADSLDAAISNTVPSLGAYFRTITIHGSRR